MAVHLGSLKALLALQLFHFLPVCFFVVVVVVGFEQLLLFTIINMICYLKAEHPPQHFRSSPVPRC